uniref:FMRFamide-related peptide n=1 Tax=Globodera pallida TaxID=36090 RepID=Q9BI00_GLOPA|nr:FMRFamide-related peptide precursor [Globodera pallida]
MCRRGMAQHFGGPIHCRPSEKAASTMTKPTTSMICTGIRQRHNSGVGLRPLILLLNSAIVWCLLAQPHTVDAAVSSGHLAPMVPNSLLSIQSDPNFLRFGRSGSLNEFGIPHQTPTRTSSNFLRFGKSSASMSTSSEPNFLRFGRQKGGVDPTFLRFGRANNNFLRFGRAAGGELLVAAEEEPFERNYRQANPNFLRFG